MRLHYITDCGLALRRLHPLLLLLAAPLAGCTGTSRDIPDFERHRYSALVQPYDRKDVMYFDVIFSADYPDGDTAAEATRMRWIKAWLEQQHLCPAGFEVLKRRTFDFNEDNPGHYDQRYVIRCKSAASG